MCNKCCIGCCIYSAVLLLLIAILLFVIVPLVFMFSIGSQKTLIFPTYLLEPKNYTNPEEYGITGVRNMYINVPYPDSNITLGVWQVLPSEMVSDIVKNDEYNFDGALSNQKYHILLYLHGNGSDRTKSIELFKILRDLFHIFAVDYRGYADSTAAELTEDAIVTDLKFVYKWLKGRSKSKIFIWGHSLGTGIATHLISSLKKEDLYPAGLVLETPFTSVTDVIKNHPIYKFYSFLPWCDATLLEPFRTNGMDFNSKMYITDVDCPIMILHAEDDEFIPFQIATELYFTAINNRNLTYQGEVTYHLYGPDGYGHMLLYLAPELPNQVKDFLSQCLEFNKKNL